MGVAADAAMAATQSVVLATVGRFIGSLPFSSAQAVGQDLIPSPVSAAVPAAGVAMVEAAGGPARVVADLGQTVAAGVQTAAVVLPRTFFYFPRIDPAAFNDAMAAFITDSVATPKPAAAMSRRRVRAWVVTAVVMAADVALLFSWHRSRVKSSSKRPHPQRWRHHARPQA
jgi:hypothetical protein